MQYTTARRVLNNKSGKQGEKNRITDIPTESQMTFINTVSIISRPKI